MKLFSILVKDRRKKPWIHHYTVIQDIPPVAQKINPGLYYFSGDVFIIDLDYVQTPQDKEAGTFVTYKNLMLHRLKNDRIL